MADQKTILDNSLILKILKDYGVPTLLLLYYLFIQKPNDDKRLDTILKLEQVIQENTKTMQHVEGIIYSLKKEHE